MLEGVDSEGVDSEGSNNATSTPTGTPMDTPTGTPGTPVIDMGTLEGISMMVDAVRGQQEQELRSRAKEVEDIEAKIRSRWLEEDPSMLPALSPQGGFHSGYTNVAIDGEGLAAMATPLGTPPGAAARGALMTTQNELHHMLHGVFRSNSPAVKFALGATPIPTCTSRLAISPLGPPTCTKAEDGDSALHRTQHTAENTFDISGGQEENGKDENEIDKKGRLYEQMLGQLKEHHCSPMVQVKTAKHWTKDKEEDVLVQHKEDLPMQTSQPVKDVAPMRGNIVLADQQAAVFVDTAFLSKQAAKELDDQSLADLILRVASVGKVDTFKNNITTTVVETERDEEEGKENELELNEETQILFQVQKQETELRLEEQARAQEAQMMRLRRQFEEQAQQHEEEQKAQSRQLELLVRQQEQNQEVQQKEQARQLQVLLQEQEKREQQRVQQREEQQQVQAQQLQLLAQEQEQLERQLAEQEEQQTRKQEEQQEAQVRQLKVLVQEQERREKERQIRDQELREEEQQRVALEVEQRREQQQQELQEQRRQQAEQERQRQEQQSQLEKLQQLVQEKERREQERLRSEAQEKERVAEAARQEGESREAEKHKQEEQEERLAKETMAKEEAIKAAAWAMVEAYKGEDNETAQQLHVQVAGMETAEQVLQHAKYRGWEVEPGFFFDEDESCTERYLSIPYDCAGCLHHYQMPVACDNGDGTVTRIHEDGTVTTRAEESVLTIGLTVGLEGGGEEKLEEEQEETAVSPFSRRYGIEQKRPEKSGQRAQASTAAAASGTTVYADPSMKKSPGKRLGSPARGLGSPARGLSSPGRGLAGHIGNKENCDGANRQGGTVDGGAVTAVQAPACGGIPLGTPRPSLFDQLENIPVRERGEHTPCSQVVASPSIVPFSSQHRDQRTTLKLFKDIVSRGVLVRKHGRNGSVSSRLLITADQALTISLRRPQQQKRGASALLGLQNSLACMGAGIGIGSPARIARAHVRALEDVEDPLDCTTDGADGQGTSKSVRVADILRVEEGKTTAVFERTDRSKRRSGRLRRPVTGAGNSANNCFSLILPYRTIDLEVEDSMSFNILVSGFRLLLESSGQHGEKHSPWTRNGGGFIDSRANLGRAQVREIEL
jgi:hypothetical protein